MLAVHRRDAQKVSANFAEELAAQLAMTERLREREALNAAVA
jgi:hypothetical protein